MRDARAAVSQGNIFLIDQDVITEDAIELGYDIGDELPQVLTELLEETTVHHYACSRPPQKYYKQDIEGLELFTFLSRATGLHAGCISSLPYLKIHFGWFPCIRID